MDLNKILGETLGVYREIIDRKGICLIQEMNRKSVYGDESMIKSVIRNLIDNAIKNTPNGSITITSSCEPDTDICEIIIADEGKGMTEEQVEAINIYFESDNEILPFSSLGYGHKVIKDFVHKLGGDISSRPNNPCGIIATLNLPVQKTQEMKEVEIISQG